MECNRCVVAQNCPRRGSSPLVIDGKTLKCRIVGGFGREPVDRTILSEESRLVSDRDGPCLTIAEIPTVDDQKIVMLEVTKIFSSPNLTERETHVQMTSSDLETRSYNLK